MNVLLTGFLLLWLACAPLAAAQAGEGAGIEDEATRRQAIEERIAALESATELEEGQRTRAASAYRQALVALQELAQQRAAAERFDQLIDNGREEIAATERRLAELETQEPGELAVPADAPASVLVPRLERARAEAASASASLQSLRTELATLADRPAAIREETARIEAQLSTLRSEREALDADVSVPAEVREARSQAVRAQRAAAQATLERLEKELVAVPIRRELLEIRRREAAARLRLVEARVSALQALVAAAQRSEALAAIADAGVAIPPEAAAHPAVRALRADNIETARSIRRLADLVEEVRVANEAVTARKEEIETSLERARRQLAIAGANEVIGRILLRERRALPDLPEYRARVAQREVLVREAGLRALDLESERRGLEEPERYLAERFGDLGEAGATVRETVRELVRGRATLVGQATDANEQYLARLSELAFEEEQLLQAAAEFDEFLAGNLLWIQTRDPIGPGSIAELLSDIREFADPRWWTAALAGLARAALTMPGLLATLAIGVWFAVRRRLLAKLRATAAGVGKPSIDTFSRTLRALGLTLLLALPLAAYLGIIGHRLRILPLGEYPVQALGETLVVLAPLVFFFSALRVLCVRDGLALVHFRWQFKAVRSLRRQLDALVVTFLIPAFVLVLVAERSGQTGGGELLRMLLLVLLGGLAAFLYRLFHPRRGIAGALQPGATGDLALRRGWLWFGLALVIPLALAIAAIVGYVYSAATLFSGLVSTLWLIVGAVVLQEVVYRWLLVARRRIRLQQLLARREAQRAAQEDPADELEAKRTELDTSVDVEALDADTRKLVRIAVVLGSLGGVYWIWADMLPALTVLDSIGLWKTDAGTLPDQPLRTVSLADVLLAIVVVGLTFVSARTLPSVIEIALRQRRDLGLGSRMAFATLARYAIFVLGAFLALNIIGASWSKLQWLVAALGVGIGFGLQEIVANFISGLIILLERPIRVGDVVTVGEVEGVVTRIQIRATTVTNWQRQEHLVPNKEFITGRVKNWSLSDEVTRVEVPVGVAYGSDVDRALEILREIAREHPKVLSEPAPLIGFWSFGDNALGLEVRCYVPNIGDRLSTITDLHLAVNRRFAEAGIVIAFPQRDVHLDLARPLDVNLRRLDDDPVPAGGT